MSKFLNGLYTILNWIKNNRAEIGGVLSFVIVFLIGRGYMSQDVAAMITGILGLLGLTVRPIQQAYAKARKAASKRK